MGLSTIDLCTQEITLHRVWNSKSPKASIYTNHTPWPVAITVAAGTPGSLGDAGGVPEERWIAVYDTASGKEVSNHGAGANLFSTVLQPGEELKASAEQEMVYRLLAIKALVDETGGLPKPQRLRTPRRLARDIIAKGRQTLRRTSTEGED
ncbi:MAG TPA: hypothetical protein VLI06_07095 [Solimonas sp.]|nr:hypothetical protein [Solimonas sp.]